MYGIGGGFIWEYDFGNKSMFRLSGLYGYGATDFQGNIGNQISQVNTAWRNQINRFVNRPMAQQRPGSAKWRAIHRGEPGQPRTEALATAYFVWNPVDCFALGVWANWEYNGIGSEPLGTNGSGNLVEVGGSRNIVTVGVRPVYWISDNIAIQGVAAGTYIDNVRANSGSNCVWEKWT